MNNQIICSYCKNEVITDFEFCPYCGTIFIEEVKCFNHPADEAEGVCLICENAYCSTCGRLVNDKFLCEKHSSYEIYQSMARVYGSVDQLAVNYIDNIFKEEGLHPFIFLRKASPISLGGPDYTLFRAFGEYNGHIINEIKLMVPLNEVLKAETILTGLIGKELPDNYPEE